ncbi:retrotransposon protein, putative, unclassified [Tanacetum coccineum]
MLTRVLRIILEILLDHPSDTYVFTMKMEIMLVPTSNKLLDSYKDGDGDASFQLKSDSLPHAHAKTTKTYYKHQDSRIKKAQELKTKTSVNSDIQDLPLRYQVYQGRLLASFQDDAKCEHTKSKDNDKGSRSKIAKHEGTSLQRRQRQRSQDLNDKSNLIDLMKECHIELTSREIVSLKILSRTRNHPRNVNLVNARNPTVRACYECGSTDHVMSACPRLNRAQGPKENRLNQVAANNRGQGHGNQGN